MDNKHYHRGSGEVVETKNKPNSDLVTFGNYESWLDKCKLWEENIASLPAIGSIDPSYPVGWVGDDVEMVWQVMSKKSAETMNGIWLDCSQETYDDYLKGNVDRRILFLPVNKVTIKSESHVDLSGVEFVQPDYTELRPCDCKDLNTAKKLNEQGIGHNDESITVMPNYVLLKMGHTEIKIGMNRFKMFAEWYLEPQKINT